MPARRLASLIQPILAFVEWLFSAAAPGVDMALAVLEGGWLVLMVSRPDIFDRYNLVGMNWLPDLGWIVFVAAITALHVIGLLRLRFYKLRVAACLASAWYWLLIEISITRVGLSTGSITYALIGAASLAAAIYLSGPRSRQAR